MSLETTAFIGFEDTVHDPLPLDKLLTRHAVLRDAVASAICGEHNPKELWTYIVLASFSYAFNAYKAIGLVLPERYHESGSVMLRQLWEVSLNLHWIERDPEVRARDFSNFTVMEMRKAIQKAGSPVPLTDFDSATSRFQSKFRFQDRRGKPKTHSNFAASTVQERADELGDPWKNDYAMLYHIASMHAHGAPGAILQQHFTSHSESPQTREINLTALVAIVSMRILTEDVHLLVRQGIVSDSKAVDEALIGALDPDEGNAAN